jgi:hypothetical protein
MTAIAKLFISIGYCNTTTNPINKIFNLRHIFLESLKECCFASVMIDVSNIYKDNPNITCLGYNYMKEHDSRISIDGLNIYSDNIEGYKTTINILGSEYHHHLICFKLKFYIKNNNFEEISKLISNIDPRINDYVLYNIAKESNNNDVINIVLYKILYLNWLEKQVFVQYLGDNTPYKELFNYMKHINKND